MGGSGGQIGRSNGPVVFAVQGEIYNLKQGDQDVASYYNEFVRLWAYEDALSVQELYELGARCKSTKCM